MLINHILQNIKINVSSTALLSANCSSQLSSPINGNVSIFPESPLGPVAVYNCDDGYVLVGSSVRVCEPRGWSGNEPTCEVLTESSEGSLFTTLDASFVAVIGVLVALSSICTGAIVVVGILYGREKKKRSQHVYELELASPAHTSKLEHVYMLIVCMSVIFSTKDSEIVHILGYIATYSMVSSAPGARRNPDACTNYNTACLHGDFLYCSGGNDLQRSSSSQITLTEADQSRGYITPDGEDLRPSVSVPSVSEPGHAFYENLEQLETLVASVVEAQPNVTQDVNPHSSLHETGPVYENLKGHYQSLLVSSQDYTAVYSNPNLIQRMLTVERQGHDYHIVDPSKTNPPTVYDLAH